MLVWKKIFGLLCLAVAMPSLGATVTYDYSGSIHSVNRLLSSEISVGDHLNGSFTIRGDSSSSALNRDLIDGQISIGDFDYEFTDYDLFLHDGSRLDIFWVFNSSYGAGDISGPSINNQVLTTIQFILFDTVGFRGGYWTRPDAISGLNPSQLLQLSLFDSARIVLGFGHRQVSAQITSLSAVPLPAAAWLFVLGLGGLVGRKLSRRDLPIQ